MLLFLTIGLTLFINIIAGDRDVLGCGGFIRAPNQGDVIDFSRVNVQLHSKQGTLKYETDCAPNNGYYFIPIYEHGEYVLKVVPPSGWQMTPSEISIHFDGVSDACSRNEDLNFHFSGFGITGSVISKGSLSGPNGLELQLLDSKLLPVQTVKTSEGGKYVFPATAPGKYVVRANSEIFEFVRKESSVIVGEDVTISDPIVIAGYDVSGRVTLGNDNPLSNIKMQLRADGVLFETTTDDSGVFRFHVVPHGKYVIAPENLKTLSIAPTSMEANVGHNHLVLSSKFVVEGFTLVGQVRGMKNPENCEIELIDDKGTVAIKTRTGRTDGKFDLPSVKTGKYELKLSYDGFDFDNYVLDITGPNFQLPLIKPSRFRLSGRVDRSGAGTGEIRVKFVSKEPEEKIIGNVLVSDKGLFSIYLPPGKISASVEVTTDDFRKGLGGFAPVEYVVDIKNEPVNNVEFAPIKVTVSGSVSTFEKDVLDLVAILTCVDLEEVKLSSEIVGGKFKFSGVLPGTYSLTVSSPKNLCWKTPSRELRISQDISDVDFVQRGYDVRIHASHAVTVSFDNGQTAELKSGSNIVCVESRKRTTVTPKDSCHVFDISDDVIDLTSDREIRLTARSHRVSGYVRSSSPIPDLEIIVVSDENKRTTSEDSATRKIDYVKTGDRYEFYFSAESRDRFQVSPQAKEHLFDPETLHLTMDDDCMIDALQFEAREGIFLRGKVFPKLSGVKVSIDNDLFGITDDTGSYQIGPLPDDDDADDGSNNNGKSDVKKFQSGSINIKAEKEGYVFKPSTTKFGDFEARKLASITIEVFEGSELLTTAGVVVSVSGGEKNYRSNAVTKAGTVSFMMLEPGEYFVKPMLKEYEFEPKSQLLKVQEGGTETVRVSAKRVAFSLYGKVTSLNGDPESGVPLIASSESPEKCPSEEAVSETSGDFRIRGLVPGCQYAVKLHRGVSSTVETILPESTFIRVESRDVVESLKLVAMMKFTSTDVSLLVENDASDTYASETATQIKVSMRSTHDDSVHHVTKSVTGHIIVLPSVPTNKQHQYHIKVESINEKFGGNKKSVATTFASDKSYKFIHLVLEKAEIKVNTDKASNYWIWRVIPIVVITGSTYYYMRHSLPFQLPFEKFFQGA